MQSPLAGSAAGSSSLTPCTRRTKELLCAQDSLSLHLCRFQVLAVEKLEGIRSFKYPKFHANCKYADLIRELGTVALASASSGEATLKEIKAGYMNSNKKAGGLERQVCSSLLLGCSGSNRWLVCAAHCAHVVSNSPGECCCASSVTIQLGLFARVNDMFVSCRYGTTAGMLFWPARHIHSRRTDLQGARCVDPPHALLLLLHTCAHSSILSFVFASAAVADCRLTVHEFDTLI